jgi:hypothetical protein
MFNRRHFLRAMFGGAAVAGVPSELRAAGKTIPDLKITGVKIHIISQALPEPMGYCCAPGAVLGMKSMGSSIVEVETDAGLTGWGDGPWGGEVLRTNRGLLIGRSPFEAEAIFDEITDLSADAFQARLPRFAPSPGGLDVALWDLMGKALGKPVCQILGKQHRKRVMPYASAGYRKNWKDLEAGFAEELRHWTHDVGFRAAKVKTGYDPVTDYRVVGAVRKAIGEEIHLGIDSGRRSNERRTDGQSRPLRAGHLQHEWTGYRCIDRDVLVERAATPRVSQREIHSALEQPPTFPDRFNHKRYV